MSAHLRLVVGGLAETSEIDEDEMRAAASSGPSDVRRELLELPGLLGSDVRFGLRGSEGATGGVGDDLVGHVARFGPRPSAVAEDGRTLLAALEEVELSGRGGGHFPAARKWRAAIGAGGGGVVVANGAEGEPLSAKDAALLQLRPHLVLDGLVCTAEAVGAHDAVIWIHEGAVATRRAVAHAIAERRAAGFREPAMRIVVGPDHYLSGESSAVVRALSGGPALPLLSRLPAAVEGIGGAPTVVQNVETLARVGLIARSGAERCVDTTLVTVVQGGERVVREVPPDTRLGSLIHPSIRSEAVLVGGYGGTWLPFAVAADLRLNEPGLRRAGYSLGAGVVAALPSGACGIAETAAVLRYLADSGAGQCGPCVFGLPATADLFAELAEGRAGRSAVRRLRSLAGEIDGRGACHHPDGVMRLMRSALVTFAADAAQHARGRVCVGSTTRRLLPVPRTV